MLDTKLKNSRKVPIVLMVLIVILSSLAMISTYPQYNRNHKIEKKVQKETILSMTDAFIGGTYFLYNQAYERIDYSEMATYDSLDNFWHLKGYVDCGIFDRDGNSLLKNSIPEKTNKLSSNKLYYALRLKMVLDEEGFLDDIDVEGTEFDEKDSIQLEQNLQNWYSAKMTDAIYSDFEDIEENLGLIPQNVTVVYGFSEAQLESFLEMSTDDYSCGIQLYNDPLYQSFSWGIMAVVVFLGILIASNKRWNIHRCKLFTAPYELIALVWMLVFGFQTEYAQLAWKAICYPFDYWFDVVRNVLMWMLVYGLILWGAICLQEIFILKGAYWKERSFFVSLYRFGKEKAGVSADGVDGKRRFWGVLRGIWNGIKSWCFKVYDEFLHMDLTEDSNKMLIKALVLNFIFLTVITCFWFFGIFALMAYSVILFIILRKYFQEIKKKYALLLKSTNLLADGNLDVPLEEDYGLFNPMKTELQKIQKGFKKAVDEEVKSERMKTELITNVSHDLKTPLTSIITYVDLLKNEENSDKRKEYLDVLEKKSLRLKVLIEDLFEISKASSKNVIMNFMDVDIVGLLKQVALECDEKIRASQVEFRWKLPEGKVVMLLDSQKTYRIFENLIVNITKYAMPQTRAYVEFQEEENMVVVTMKNISATELNFSTEEITDRFVRGDASRNTEGSGLGLAIAKSFTELQYGTMEISTDADLFKVEIHLPKRSSHVEVTSSEAPVL